MQIEQPTTDPGTDQYYPGPQAAGPQFAGPQIAGTVATDDAKRQRLFNSIQSSYRNLDQYRKVNRELVEEFAGPFYTKSGRNEKYMYLLQQAMDAYLMVLVGEQPRCLLTTLDPQLAGFAYHFQTALNTLLRDMEIGAVFEQWVMNAFFSIGIIKVHMAETGELIAEDDILMDPGKPFASNISLDDWIHDTGAKRWEECKYFGDMYQIPHDELRNEFFDQEQVALIQPNETLSNDGERIEQMSRDHDGADEFEPMVDLADIYIPREGMVYTFHVKDRTTFQLSGKPLASFEWTGRELGPYHQLSFINVPENVMPASMAAGWLPTEKLVNNLMRKSARQARRSKEVGIYGAAGSDSAKQIQTAGDGEFCEVNNPQDVDSIRVGGVDSGNHAFMIETMKLFNRNAGNVDAMLGLGPSTDTVGQEKIVAGAASRREEALQKKVLKAATGVIREIAQLLWDDDFTEIKGQATVDGFPEITAMSNWFPEDREGAFSDYRIEIDVYSMQHQGPGERVQTLTRLLQEIYAPLMPVLMQQGGTIDMAMLTNLFSEYLDSPHLKDIIRFIQPMDQGQGGQQMEQRKSPVSNRTYTRRNVSGNDAGAPDATAVAQAQTPQT